jgi:hypothetical protein
MGKKENGPYKKWLNSSDKTFKVKLIDSLNKAGAPLEYKTKRRLENLGFEANPYHYEPEVFPYFEPSHPEMPIKAEIKRRELDLLATLRRGWSIPIKGGHLLLRLKLAVECKYSSSKDFFVFEFQDKLISLPNFPVKLKGQKILPELLYKYFDVPTKIEKVTEVDVSTLGSRGEGNFNDRMAHAASEQLSSAISNILYDRYSEIHRIYFDIVKQMDIRGKFEKLDREGKIKRVEEPGRSYIPEDEKDDFCRKNIAHFNFEKIGTYRVDLVFPVIVIDDTRGVIKAVLNDANEIVDFEDVGYGIYKYVSEKVQEEVWFGAPKLDKELPIIICNLSYLDECISKLVGGMEELKLDVEKQLNENPHLFVTELMFNL